MRRSLILIVLMILLGSTIASNASRLEPPPESNALRNTKTQDVMLGTGTPNADPERSGPSVAIVVNDTPYLIDFGPGVVRRAAAAFKAGVQGLEVKNLKRAFITHLHSDHTVGYPDLIFTPA